MCAENYDKSDPPPRVIPKPKKPTFSEDTMYYLSASNKF